jgi:hypothetical protein
MKSKATATSRRRRQLLEQIGVAAQLCREVEQEFGQEPAPVLETLIKLHRMLVMNLAGAMRAKPNAGDMRLLTSLMKAVMEFGRIEEKRADRAFAETKYQESLRTKLDAGLEAVGDALKANPEALGLYRQARELVRPRKSPTRSATTAPVAAPPPLAPGGETILSQSTQTDPTRRIENGPTPPAGKP